MSIKIFEGKVLIDGIIWNKKSYQKINKEPLPSFLYIYHDILRIGRDGDIYNKSISECRTHPWQEKRKGFLIASNYKNGAYFHVLKQIVCFL